ncbi:MarR family transcriptional regulator [Kitasatospora sp. RB6PN24]|uniref:MarR family winged helix-turn-helix transcriptional regulator n=1 Tax=Kitasatospora humi TaxID=2893891 RepID=UPI001E419973|nr:MarR family transcriptional regulator [Kitasatospora humi]MCC9309847.1 MarR family transcriptional regulator [Kitasatospora humi]
MTIPRAASPGPTDTALADDFSALLVGIQRLVRRKLRQGQVEPRLRGAHVELLRLVMDTPGLRVSDAAKELCLAGNSVSTLVNQLVTQGLLQREVDPADRRAARLFATDEAVERIGAWRAKRAALIETVVADLSTSDQAALAAALPALRGVANGLRAQLGEDAR